MRHRLREQHLPNGVGNSNDNPAESQTATEMKVFDIPYEPTEDELLASAIDDKLSLMSLHDKVSQMVITRPEDVSNDKTSFTQTGKDNLAAYPFGGVCYFSDNLSTPSELSDSIASMNAFVAGDPDNTSTNAGIGMFVSIDEEGGGLAYPGANPDSGPSLGVTRLARADFPGTTRLYPMFYYKDDSAHTAHDNAALIASYLRQYGFNWDFAPVADTNSNPDNPIIGYRAYSTITPNAPGSSPAP